VSKIIQIFGQLQIIALCLFCFSINFEVWDPLSTGGIFSISKLTGFVYLATILPQLKRYTRTDLINCFMRPIWLFFGLLTLISLINVNKIAWNFFDISLFQNIILFLILMNHARKDSSVLDKGMLSFAFGSVVLALLFNSGIGVEYKGGRVTVFGDNENIVGLRMCISMIILMLSVVQDRFMLGKWRYLFLLPIPIMLHLMFQTGSRVSLISACFAFMFGVILLKVRKITYKILSFIVGVIIFTYGFNFMMQSETLLKRLLSAAGEGDLSGRDVIWTKLFSLIENNPILGVGKTGYAYFSQDIFGNLISPHNVILEVLCYTGIVGLFIYLFFLYRVFKAGLNSYKIYGLLLPLLLLFPIVGILLSGQILNVKIGWVIFAYIAGSSVFKFNPETVGSLQSFKNHENTLRY
jgi:O-antigen ligase